MTQPPGRSRVLCVRTGLTAGFGLVALLTFASLAIAEGEQGVLAPALFGDFSGADRRMLFMLSFVAGLLMLAAGLAIFHLRARTLWIGRERTARTEMLALLARAERAEELLMAEPQLIAVWSGADDLPLISGELTGVAISPSGRGLIGTGWLDYHDTRSLDEHIRALRERGEGFRLVARSRHGGFIEAEGRAIGGRAVLRLREVTGDRLELARLADRHRRATEEIEAIRALLDEAPVPLWLRNANDKLTWVNRAYAKAVDAADEADVLARDIELLDRPAREEAGKARREGRPFLKRVPAVVGSARRTLDVIDIPSSRGSAGMAIDVSEVETMRADIGRQIEAHVRTLDQLATAVAIFDADQHLTFYNAAFSTLWQLDPAFLDEKPSDSEILDRLRAQRRLPEQADFRAWKSKLHEAYRALEPAEHWWHLPDGRTSRVVTTPNPAGGVTYLFEDVTERIDLEARYKALSRVQGETLENLKEGVAAFGSDGRLRLSNPAFAAIWRLPSEMMEQRPHIDDVVARCSILFRDEAVWQALKSVITSFGDARHSTSKRMIRVDGSVIDVATVPLPDGGTLATFTDVTDSVNFENALVEKNEALEEAARLKNDFVHHVSYELRSPLTNIIGFVQLLADGSAGPLNDKQHQYAGYIKTSSDALYAIINNILDLATIDAGAMTLDLGMVDIREAMQGVAEAVQPRLAESGVRLEMKASHAIGEFEADGQRVRQVLFNLLSNAIGFSQPGGTVTLSALRKGQEIVFRVEDRGRGISQAVIDRVFDRFESHGGSGHRGVGLGLSIVRSFVELHGGTVELVSEEGRGTIVTCRLPIDSAARRKPAERNPDLQRMADPSDGAAARRKSGTALQ
ncbi:sensor histidine kinase [Labrys monachus]|uniref:histidine kinase n=1 Tax=Labrys monachus TaxID=217067 RepID=A0ABU0FN34_9HYPH|nr:PAS domain-containing sensor histidine kinase [Labrys monachus]MDQ0396023.1 signal transduction histidine kinase [Labrys monachus]